MCTISGNIAQAKILWQFYYITTKDNALSGNEALLAARIQLPLHAPPPRICVGLAPLLVQASIQ